jgi:CRISPR-associated endonuclease Cas2
MFYLVCYDVVLDRRRNKVAHILEGYGLRVQKSVFECVLTPDQSWRSLLIKTRIRCGFIRCRRVIAKR